MSDETKQDTKQDTKHAREKMDEAVHILKKDVVTKLKAVLDDMYESVDLYEKAVESKNEDDGYAKFHNLPILGVCGQWVAVFLVGIGIGVEYTLHADIGYIAITSGALVLALATKLKYYRTRRK